jgi:streptogramin lyase
MGIVSGVLALTCAPAPAIATADPGPVLGPSYHPGGEPLILASDGHGGIWYGGAATYVVSEESEAESSIWHLTAAGVTRIQLPTTPMARFAQYFATGQDGMEWFLAENDLNASVELGRVSTSGELTLTPIAIQKGVRLRGLTVDSRGNLWSTQNGTKGRWRRAGVVRIAPDGHVTVFRHGLMKGAIPANIETGAHGSLWFLDDEGRIGHVLADGRIEETLIGRPIVTEERAFAPMRPLIVTGDRLWFIAGPETLAEMMTTTGRTRFITPHSSYPGLEGQGGRDGDLVGLTIAPDGDLWFTRDSGEVARIRADGRVQTITNRLVDAYGIAFDGQGHAWVGEGPGYGRRVLGETPFNREVEAQMALPRIEPARLAEVELSGRTIQFPRAPSCRVPSLIGVERSLVWLESAEPFRVSESEPSLSYCEHRIRLGQVNVTSRGSRGRVFVVAQQPAPGSRTHGYVTVNIILAAPSTPRSCGVPRPFRALYRSRRLLVWRVATAAPENEGVRETYYACLPGHHEARRITWVGSELESGDSIARMAYAGHYIAYVTRFGGKYGSNESLTVEDVAMGSASTTETEAYASEYGGQPGPERLPALERLGAPLGRRVFELALSSDGEVAWVGHSEASLGSPSQSILYLRDRDSIRRLAVASQISAVRFSDATVEWREDGQARSTRG